MPFPPGYRVLTPSISAVDLRALRLSRLDDGLPIRRRLAILVGLFDEDPTLGDPVDQDTADMRYTSVPLAPALHRILVIGAADRGLPSTELIRRLFTRWRTDPALAAEVVERHRRNREAAAETAKAGESADSSEPERVLEGSAA